MSLDLDYCEYPAFWREDKPKARKEHKCSCCGEVIPAGTTYKKIVLENDGDVETVKQCLRCAAIYNHLQEVSPRGETPDLYLDCGHDYKEVHGKEPPLEIAALAFALPGEVTP